MERFHDRHHRVCDIDHVLLTYPSGGTQRFSSIQGVIDALNDLGKTFSDCDVYYAGGVLFVDCD